MSGKFKAHPKIEQARDHIGIETAHLRWPVRRSDHGQTGSVVREHNFQQLPVEPVRARWPSSRSVIR